MKNMESKGLDECFGQYMNGYLRVKSCMKKPLDKTNTIKAPKKVGLGSLEAACAQVQTTVGCLVVS